MLFVLDIGNTNMVAGLYAGGRLAYSWRFATDAKKTPDEYLVLLRGFLRQADVRAEEVKDSVLASVVPALVGIFEDTFEKLFGVPPLIVTAKLNLGGRVRVDHPAEVGADRLVNAVAGFAMFKCPLVIVDFGTGITVDAVSGKGDYLGGAIAPGVGISLEALVARASRLPRIEMKKPLRAIGSNTIEAMRSGVYFGAVGQIKEIILRVKKELGKGAKVIATGGYAHWIPAKEVGIQQIVPDLTLEGLRLIYERNSKRIKKKAGSKIRTPKMRY
jgi:type III pantothenate kinase